MINADDKLFQLFKANKISIFGLAQIISDNTTDEIK